MDGPAKSEAPADGFMVSTSHGFLGPQVQDFETIRSIITSLPVKNLLLLYPLFLKVREVRFRFFPKILSVLGR